MALDRVQKKGRIDGLLPQEDSRVIDQFMDDVINFINEVVSGGSTGDVSASVGGLFITRDISESVTIPSGKTLVQRDPVLGFGVTITIENTGELYVL